MADLDIVKPTTLDILDKPGTPALSSTSDMPVVETKPDAQNEGAPPAVPVEGDKPETEAEQPGESATPATEEPTGQPAEDKVPRGVGKRLAELTKRIDEGERRYEAEKAEKLRLLALLEGKKEPEAAPEETEPVRPNKLDFTDPDSYERALLDYTEQRASFVAKKEVEADRRAREAEERQRRNDEIVNKVQQDYEGRVAKAREKYPDFEEIANTDQVRVTQLMIDAMRVSEQGPDLQYYFGKNPQEAQRISQLNAYGQLMELGKIEARLSQPPPKPNVSAAPAPLKPTRPTSETQSMPMEEMSMEEYAAHRRKTEGWADPQRPRTRH